VLSVIAVILIAPTVTWGAIVFNNGSIRDTSPLLFRSLLYTTFLLSTIALVLEYVVLVMRKRFYRSFTSRKENLVFLMFTMITAIIWFSHGLEFAGLLERSGISVVSSVFYSTYAPLSLFAVLFLMPLSCLTIIVLAILSLGEHFLPNK